MRFANGAGWTVFLIVWGNLTWMTDRNYRWMYLWHRVLRSWHCEQPVEKITIKQITDGAGVIRPTFITISSDKYGLLEWIWFRISFFRFSRWWKMVWSMRRCRLFSPRCRKEKDFYMCVGGWKAEFLPGDGGDRHPFSSYRHDWGEDERKKFWKISGLLRSGLRLIIPRRWRISWWPGLRVVWRFHRKSWWRYMVLWLHVLWQMCWQIFKGGIQSPIWYSRRHSWN